MKLSFDKFERYELPQVTLCNPNSRATEVDGKITITDTVGVLSNPKGMNLKLNFNAPHELSFDYYRHKGADPIGMPTEYIVEILNQSNQLVKQVDTFLSYDEAEKCVEEFDLSTLNNGEYLNIIKQSFYDSIYEAIQTDRYVYLTDIGYFIISGVTDSDEDNIDKKSISLKSCEENEFAIAEGLGLKEGTYQLHTHDNKGLLDLFLPKTVGWTIGFIDPALLTKYDSETGEEKAVERYVEKTEVDNGYNFLYTTIQDMFECIVEPDIIKRTISVYSRVYYAEHHLTDIHIAKYNLLKHKTVEENDEDKYTALNVQGKDENLEIRAVNPTGKNVIYNFEPRYSWMSPALQQAIEKWQEKCESVEERYLTLQQGYYNDMQNIVFPLEEDIKVLELQLKQQQQTRDLIVIGEQDKAIDIVKSLPQTGKSDVLYFVPTTANNYEEYVWENNSWKYIDLIQVDDISDTNQQRALDLVNAAINNTNVALSGKQSTLDTEKNNVETNYSQPISNINKECALETTSVFTTELRNELMTHIKPTDYIDEYMLVTESMTYPQRFEKAKELMDRAQSQLIKISSGQKTYSIDTRSFLFNKQFKHFSEQLCAGAIIYVETKSDTMEQLHLTGIDISFDEKSTNFTLGNKYDRSDLKALYDDALGQNSKSFSELKYITSIIEDQKKQLDYQKNWVADLRTLTLDNVLTSEDQAIEINNRGLIGRKRQLNEDGTWKIDDNGNPLFDSEQVKLINNTLVFTDNNWQNATTAVGKIAVGYNADGSVKYAYGINGQVLIGELILGNNLVLTGTGAGIKITDNNGNDAFYADENGDLILSGTIFAKGGQISGWNIGKFTDVDANYTNSIYSEAHASGETTYYRVFLRSSSNPTNVAIGVKEYAGSLNGDSTYNFYVTNKGRLYANDAEIEGKITAETGKIADWDIVGGYMRSSTNYATTDGDSLYTIIKGSGEVAFATNATSATNTAGASSQIFHDGSARFGRFVESTTNTSDNAYSLAVSYAGTKIYNDIRVYCESTFDKQITASNGILSQGKIYANGGIDVEGGTLHVKSGKHCKFDSGITVGSSSLDSSPHAQSVNFSTSGMVYAKSSTRYVRMNGYSYSDGAAFYVGHYTTVDDESSWKTKFSVHWDGGVRGYGFSEPSDQSLKKDISCLDERYSILFDNLSPKTYRYIHGDSGRLHTGLVAQEVKEAMDIAGIDTSEFAAYVKDNVDNSETLSLRYSEFIALLINEVQILKAKIQKIEQKTI